MHIFITGGTGLIGPAVVSELITAGHTATGLNRSEEAAARLQGLGTETLRGSLENLDSLRKCARMVEGVIHMAFGGGSFADPDDLVRRDRTAIQTLGQVLVGSDKPFVSASGTFVVATGRVSTDQDPPDGSALHDTGESASNPETIAHHAGRILGIPVASVTLDGAAVRLGDPFLARCFATDAPASSAHTRALLGWTAAHPTLLQGMEPGDYFSPPAARARIYRIRCACRTGVPGSHTRADLHQGDTG